MRSDIPLFVALFCFGMICASLIGPHVQRNFKKDQIKQQDTIVVRSIEDQIADYDCIIRNSNNPDTIRWYQQKKMLLEFNRK